MVVADAPAPRVAPPGVKSMACPAVKDLSIPLVTMASRNAAEVAAEFRAQSSTGGLALAIA